MYIINKFSEMIEVPPEQSYGVSDGHEGQEHHAGHCFERWVETKDEETCRVAKQSEADCNKIEMGHE